jgi:hypothetical protein
LRALIYKISVHLPPGADKSAVSDISIGQLVSQEQTDTHTWPPTMCSFWTTTLYLTINGNVSNENHRTKFKSNKHPFGIFAWVQTVTFVRNLVGFLIKKMNIISTATTTTKNGS